ncbi:NAD-dependent epimerase/dehydratase [Sphaerisporangium flaviroseum]|uniref:NAD-dependent epimerase/dehydratase family protein n=1 Tax=Sphaerisporangium flaviroseum TaxID=509199 RepID=UPI0031EB9097
MTHPQSRARPLVTVLGASGFVGSAVVRELAGRPVRLRLVSRGPATVPVRCAAEVEQRQADVTAPGHLREVLRGTDAVLQLVAHSAGWRGADEHGDSERVNVGVMRDVVSVLGAERRSGPPPVVVFAGSLSQVGVPPRVPLTGGEPDHPVSTYDRQKQAAERALLAAAADGAVRGISLRLPTVYGDAPPERPRDRGVLATMVRRALAGQALTLWDGTVTRDLLYAGDVATAFAAALDHPGPLSGRHWLLGTGRGERLGDAFHAVVRLVAERTGRPPVPVVRVPPADGATTTDLRHMVADPEAFRSVTGWRARVGLDDGLRRLVTAIAAERG